MDEPEMTPEEVRHYALLGDAPGIRALNGVWSTALDVARSEDLRDEHGEVPEEVYLRMKAHAIRDALRELGL